MQENINSKAILVAYQNEEEHKRAFQIDFSELARLAEEKGMSEEMLKQHITGFESAIQMILSNFNVTTKKRPLTKEEFEQIQIDFRQETNDSAVDVGGEPENKDTEENW